MSTRSRHSSQASTRSHWTRASTKRRTSAKISEGKDTAGKLDNDGAPKSQTESSRIPQQEREMEYKPKPDTIKARGTQRPRRKSYSSKADSERSRKSRTKQASSGSLKSHSSHSRGEDHACRSASTSSSAQSKSRARHASPPRRHSSPSELDLLVTPDDSISQVGAARPRHRSSRTSRPEDKRRSTYGNLAPIAESDDNMRHGSRATREPIKRQSFLGSLFGRRNTTPAISVPVVDYARTSEGDRLLDMRVPKTIVGSDRRNTGVDKRQPFQDTSRRMPYAGKSGTRHGHEQIDDDLARRMQLADLNGLDNSYQGRQRDVIETWGIGNAAGHFMNDDFVHNDAKATMSTFGDANMGRRGERVSGRRKPSKEVPLPREYRGLAPNFLGDESVLGIGPAPRTSIRGDLHDRYFEYETNETTEQFHPCLYPQINLVIWDGPSQSVNALNNTLLEHLTIKLRNGTSFNVSRGTPCSIRKMADSTVRSWSLSRSVRNEIQMKDMTERHELAHGDTMPWEDKSS